MNDFPFKLSKLHDGTIACFKGLESDWIDGDEIVSGMSLERGRREKFELKVRERQGKNERKETLDL